jgi:hypothetical protein
VRNLGLVASGGGYRSFYTSGALVWLKRHDVPVLHITSTSSGNNIVLDYLLWDWKGEDLPPILTQWSLPNTSVLSQAIFINHLLETLDRPSIEVAGKTYHYKPLHILRPRNLESMTVSLKDVRAQKEYFQLGQEETKQLFESMSGKTS